MEGRKASHNNFYSEPHSPHFLVSEKLYYIIMSSVSRKYKETDRSVSSGTSSASQVEFIK